MLTIHEAMALPAFEQTTLIAGDKGADQTIKWVTTIEIIEDISRFQDGEFIITTGFGLVDDVMYQKRFIELMRSKKLAGLAVYTGFYLSDIPQIFIDEANAQQLPLIEIPSSINFSTITKALLEQIANKQIRLLENSLRVHQEMTKLAFSLDGLDHTLKKISPLTKASIYVFNDSNHFISSVKKTAHEMEINNQELAIKDEVLDLDQLFFSLEDSTCSPFIIGNYICSASKIEAKAFTYGYLLMIHLKTDWSEMEMVISDHISTLIGIELVKQYAVDETKVRIQGEFVDEILNKEHFQVQDALKRGRRLGYDLSLPHQVVYIKLPEQTEGQTAQATAASQLHYSLSLIFQEDHRQVILLPKINECYALIQVDMNSLIDENRHLLTQMDLIQNKWLQHHKEPLLFGIGRPYSDLRMLSESARQAENAVYYSHLLLHHTQTVFFDDLGFYQVLIQMENAGVSLQNYYEQYLGELVHPKHTRKDYILTLETYLANNCNLQQTSAQLYIHRHTLKYRLKQIEKKTGIQLSSPDARLNLHLAIVAYKFTEWKK
ncbi:hypothetical protein CR194_03405 [Salipaludibacillus keqinensis]|uniref:PucR family transcriptional regulator n=1 Tax=Salipaludibacillus keqinensis TaxID=2045207 RepID=A0A323TI69_9BACI|nr:PucR family transcriptional regulator ligand-binding domain-containing protein [Salipaludibacillus keqinensis]PYZ94591.1 hypothetical protein CR194_03405 [Salipaludibacillus keqinensis]